MRVANQNQPRADNPSSGPLQEAGPSDQEACEQSAGPARDGLCRRGWRGARRFLRVAAFVAPSLVFLVTWRLCEELKATATHPLRSLSGGLCLGGERPVQRCGPVAPVDDPWHAVAGPDRQHLADLQLVARLELEVEAP